MPDQTISREALENVLFLALQRPAMKWGVPIVGLMVNLVVSFLSAAWIADLVFGRLWYMFPWFACSAGAVHLLLRHASNRDHNMLRTKKLWLETKARSSLKEKWGGSSIAALPTRWPNRATDFAISLDQIDG
jgi:type IV secretory pathway VirB3-like protein